MTTGLTSLSSLPVGVESEPLAVDKLKIQEAIVINFAALLGARSAGSSSTSSGITTVSGTTKSASAHDFEDCLSDAVNDDDIVCILPSFNMKTDTHDGGTSPLPKVGEHHHNPKVPEMAASVLDTAGAAVSDEASNLEQSAAQNLGALVSWPKSTLVSAPAAVSKSVSTSFASLVESRVKAWTLLLLRHSLTNGDSSSRNRLLSMLSSKIEITGSITSFKTLALPDAARDQPRDADVILPVIFEVVLQVSSQGRSDVIPLRAPGTISGHFADTKAGASPGIVKIEVNLDTAVLLDSMVEQARLVVFKAVARVTAIDVDKTKMPTQQQTPTAISSNTSLSGFSSVLNLSAEIASQSPKLQKAQSSALRLNSILQGKSTLTTNVLHDPEHSLDQARKSRSVQWEKPVDPPKSDAATKQIAKRQRMVQSQARLRSMKSFGRPHAEPGNSEPKNATFGDFGRGANGAIWGRDGKLLNHPVPQSGLTSSAMSSLNVSGAQNSNQNATFDFSNSPQAPRQVRPNILSNLSLSGRNPNMGAPVGRGLSVGLPSTLPRTATALESWLVNNATNRNR